MRCTVYAVRRRDYTLACGSAAGVHARRMEPELPARTGGVYCGADPRPVAGADWTCTTDTEGRGDGCMEARSPIVYIVATEVEPDWEEELNR